LSPLICQKKIKKEKQNLQRRRTMATAAAAYRRVLKAVQKHVRGGASKQHFRDFVVAEFRAPAGSEADARARLRLAGDYAYHLASVHHHKVGSLRTMIRCGVFSWRLLAAT
jgi:hypothetical protein